MTENTFKIIAQLSGIFRTIILFGCFMGLWNHLIESQTKKRKIILFVIFGMYLLVPEWFSVPAYIRYIPIFIGCVAYVYIFKICKWEKPVFMLLFLYNMHTMSFLIADSLYQFLIKRLNTGLDMNAADVVERIYLYTGIMQFGLMLSYAAVFMLLYFVFIRLKPMLTDMSVMELIFLSVLNVVGIILAYMIVSLTVVPLEEEVFILYDEVSDFLWKIPIIAILLLTGEYSSILIFGRYKQFLNERENVISRELGLKQLEQRFEEAQMLYGSLRSLRHDIKNHMQAVQGLSFSGDTEAAKGYIEKLNRAMEELDGRFNTGNTLCDVVLNDKCRIAEKNKIEFHVDFRYESGISDFDLGIILSNLCDNAIEACRNVEEEKRRISISYLGVGPCMLLSVKNSYDGNRMILGENGLPVSTKNVSHAVGIQRMEHGLGLKNVSVIAEAYLGKLQIETNEKEFCATVMLQKREGVCPVVT